MNLKFNKKSGQSIIELLVALGIFVVAVSAAFQVFFGGQKIVIDSRNVNLATDYGWQAVEAVRNIRARNWSELTPGSHGLVFQNGEWLFSSSSVSNSEDIFTRTVEIGVTADENVRIATTTVTWQTDNQIKTFVIVEELTNWEAYTQSSCRAQELTGNWLAPRIIASGSIGSGNTGTDVIVKLPYIYVSSISGTSANPDLFVFEYTTSSPSLVESINIGSGGINQIFLKGNYIYASSPNDNKELVIINVTNPLDITEAGSLNLTGTSDGLGVIAFSNTAAIGRTDSAANELVFINVTNPASPTIISSQATNGDVNDFAATSNDLFLVSEESDEDVWHFNITNPANPTFVSYYDITGTTEDLSIFIHEKNGRTLLVGNEQSEIVSIGATNTAAMYVRDRTTFSGWVNDITCVAGDIAFLATDDDAKELIAINFFDPDNLSEYSSLSLSADALGIDFADNKVFIAIESSNALQIIGPGP